MIIGYTSISHSPFQDYQIRGVLLPTQNDELQLVALVVFVDWKRKANTEWRTILVRRGETGMAWYMMKTICKESMRGRGGMTTRTKNGNGPEVGVLGEIGEILMIAVATGGDVTIETVTGTIIEKMIGVAVVVTDIKGVENHLAYQGVRRSGFGKMEIA